MSSEKTQTSLLREMIELIEKYGVFKIVGASIMMLFISYVTYFLFNPSVIFERYSQYEQEKHSESFAYRMQSTPIVQSYLDNLVTETNALRGFVIELHNGKYNSAGLSFNYGSLTYEGLRDSVESIREDYSDFSLERFPIVTRVYNDGYWAGTISELSNIDKRMALRLESNDAYYIAMTTIYGTKENIGFLGVTYGKNEKFDPNEVEKMLSRYASKISPLLDGQSIKSK